MTEPRKTPRWRQLHVAQAVREATKTKIIDEMDTFARALEIETQELAEAMSRMLDVYAPYHTGLCGIVLLYGSTSPCHCTLAVRQARAALARHHAKQ